MTPHFHFQCRNANKRFRSQQFQRQTHDCNERRLATNHHLRTHRTTYSLQSIHLTAILWTRWWRAATHVTRAQLLFSRCAPITATSQLCACALCPMHTTHRASSTLLFSLYTRSILLFRCPMLRCPMCFDASSSSSSPFARLRSFFSFVRFVLLFFRLKYIIRFACLCGVSFASLVFQQPSASSNRQRQQRQHTATRHQAYTWCARMIRFGLVLLPFAIAMRTYLAQSLIIFRCYARAQQRHNTPNTQLMCTVCDERYHSLVRALLYK